MRRFVCVVRDANGGGGRKISSKKNPPEFRVENKDFLRAESDYFEPLGAL